MTTKIILTIPAEGDDCNGCRLDDGAYYCEAFRASVTDRRRCPACHEAERQAREATQPSPAPEVDDRLEAAIDHLLRPGYTARQYELSLWLRELQQRRAKP